MAIACGGRGIFDPMHGITIGEFQFFGKNRRFFLCEAIFFNFAVAKNGLMYYPQVSSGRLSAIRVYAGVADRKSRPRLVNWHDFCLAILTTKQRADDL